MINILFGGNEKAFDGILLCLLSATKYTSEILNIYILTANLTELHEDYKPITENQVKILSKVLQKKNPKSKITLISLGQEFNNWVKKSHNKFSNYTPFAFLRLFADKINNLPNKIIYLDTDILINGDIKKLFDIDISNYELGVVKDRYGHIFIWHNYFNSGMLLMNMQKLKESDLLHKVRNTCLIKKMAFPDQTALNKHCKSKLYLNRIFNEQGKLKSGTIVHHFSKKIKWTPFFHTLNIKPWQINKVHSIYKCHAYDDIFSEYTNIKNNNHMEN